MPLIECAPEVSSGAFVFAHSLFSSVRQASWSGPPPCCQQGGGAEGYLLQNLLPAPRPADTLPVTSRPVRRELMRMSVICYSERRIVNGWVTGHPWRQMKNPGKGEHG
ncbi:hypothetical protein MHM97_06470 [Epibacterium sp. Ofav1-8]|nr:hypothetical protein [Epibacterium sp. Ofav1-8]